MKEELRKKLDAETLREVRDWLERKAAHWHDSNEEPNIPFLQAGDYKTLLEALKLGHLPESST